MTVEHVVTWQMDRDAAIERLEKAGHGTVTSDGNYQRRTTLTYLAELAHEDPDASVQRVA